MKKIYLTAALIALGLAASRVEGQSACATEANTVGDKLFKLDLRQIKIGGELGRRIDLTIHGNLLKIDIDKDFIAPFVGGHYTGLNDGSGPFIGIGKTLDGMVRLAAYSEDKALLARKNHLVESIIRSQHSDGYIGMMSPQNRTWTLWDLHEQAFIITGLVSDYRLFGSGKSLASARKLADYVIMRWPQKPADWEKRLPIRDYFAELGLSYGYLYLYGATSDPRYLEFAAHELGAQTWNLGIVLGRRPPIDGHSYMYLSNCLAQLELFRTRHDPQLLVPTRRATDFMTREDGMMISGGVGQDECWTDNQDGSNHMGETCSTAYQIFVFDSLLRLQADSRWGDLIERNLYNAAFAAQSPDGRRIRYYTPFEGERVYFKPDSYCCPGNFRRLMGVVPQLVYYRTAGGIAINLYTDSQTSLDHLGGTTVVLSQETDYPRTGRVKIRIDPRAKAAFPLLLRIPSWSRQTSVAVNGLAYPAAPQPGKFLELDRTWQRGDEVTLDLAMDWRFITGRKNQAGRAALMRGPVLYTLDRGNNHALDGIDLKRLVLLPATAELVRDNKSVRPNGTACRIGADLDRAGEGALVLTLTEFPDPDGRSSYFRIPDMKIAVNDELLAPEADLVARQ